MLESLHVKNLALIDEAEVNFTDGLNILTGETGAGKSLIIGSVNLALGGKADKGYIRAGAEYALVELVFTLSGEQQEVLREMDLPVEEDGTLILQRKIMPARSVCKINGETVSSGQLKEISAHLLDMYGQHEHQSLLKPAKHRAFLDSFAKEEIQDDKQELKLLCREYYALLEEFENNSMDEASRQREADLLSFEVKEIEDANLELGEDEELEKKYRKMTGAKKIKAAAYVAYSLTGYEENESAGNSLSRALREMKSVGHLDEDAESLTMQLEEVENLLSDFNRSIADYMESLDFDEEEFFHIEERLNLINRLKDKYGFRIEQILETAKEKSERLFDLKNYEAYLEDLTEKLKEKKVKILSLCRKISEAREQAAKVLSKELIKAMQDLNFPDVKFSILVEPEEEKFSEEGYDKIEFLISTNPGEDIKPLWQVASGGELSRIMLAFKTVFAKEEGTGTLIFDEIDTGISGKTAWMVSEKLGKLSVDYQIICITHLPQIAAMADTHFMIQKNVISDRTVTEITGLSESESLSELARLLGSGNVTEAVLTNAREMKALAQKSKADL